MSAYPPRARTDVGTISRQREPAFSACAYHPHTKWNSEPLVRRRIQFKHHIAHKPAECNARALGPVRAPQSGLSRRRPSSCAHRTLWTRPFLEGPSYLFLLLYRAASTERLCCSNSHGVAEGEDVDITVLTRRRVAHEANLALLEDVEPKRPLGAVCDGVVTWWRGV